MTDYNSFGDLDDLFGDDDEDQDTPTTTVGWEDLDEIDLDGLNDGEDVADSNDEHPSGRRSAHMTTTEKNIEIWRELSDVRAELINVRVETANLDEEHPEAVQHIREATWAVEKAMYDLDCRDGLDTDTPDNDREAGKDPTDESSANRYQSRGARRRVTAHSRSPAVCGQKNRRSATPATIMATPRRSISACREPTTSRSECMLRSSGQRVKTVQCA